nr:PREDICTED: inactive rhomboid protein 2 isoform X2 [Bemisia tabaci]
MNAPDDDFNENSSSSLISRERRERERFCSHLHPYTCSIRPLNRHHAQTCYICPGDSGPGFPTDAQPNQRCPKCCYSLNHSHSHNLAERYSSHNHGHAPSNGYISPSCGYSNPNDRFAYAELGPVPKDLACERYIPSPAPSAASERYLPPPDRFLTPSPSTSHPSPPSNDRFHAPTSTQSDRYIPPPAPAPSDVYITPLSPSVSDRYLVSQVQAERYDRFLSSDRFLGELLVPSEQLGYDKYDRYAERDRERLLPGAAGGTQAGLVGGPGDPYMRRDLGYHHHYRLSNHIQSTGHFRNMPSMNRSAFIHTLHHLPSHHQRNARSQSQGKAQYLEGVVSASGSVSSTASMRRPSSRIPSLPLPLPLPAASPAPLPALPSAEYACASGNRYPSIMPPLARCSSASDVQIDKKMCLNPAATDVGGGSCSGITVPPFRRLSATPVTSSTSPMQHNSSISWRSVSSSSSSASPTPPQESASTSSTSISPPSPPSPPSPQKSRSLNGDHLSTSAAMQRSASVPASGNHSPTLTKTQGSELPEQRGNEKLDENEESSQTTASLPTEPSMSQYRTSLQHQASVPVTQAEVAAASNRNYHRSTSKTDALKKFIKKETAIFFGVEEQSQESERLRWLDRRKRLAARKYGQLRSEYQPSNISVARPDVLLAGTGEQFNENDTVDANNLGSTTLRRKPSVAKLTFNGVAYVVSTLNRQRRKASGSSTTEQTSTHTSPTSPGPHSPSSVNDEIFFNKKSPLDSTHGSTEPIVPDTVDSSSYNNKTKQGQQKSPIFHHPAKTKRRLPVVKWKKSMEDENEDREKVDGVWGQVLDKALETSGKRQYGMGVVGHFFGHSLKRTVINRHSIREQLDDLDDHRPFFTYWVTTVQIIILFLSIFCYGLGPIGIDIAHRSSQVLVTSLSLQQVEFVEPANFWIGPRAADLIHMGAKFAPCMRKDAKILKDIEKRREKERDTACCIHNDDSGCVQSSRSDCSFLIPSRNSLISGSEPMSTISTWKKWSSNETGPNGRLSGSVCGLDPKYCEAPASIAPYEWPDDITKWPICRKTTQHHSHYHHMDLANLANKDKMTAEHMICEIIGHPCCIGIHGMCRITTREYCDFVHGYFHDDASLCSQVSCLDNVCGMMPFFFPEVPDQFYRLWTSLFLHAGVMHLAITVVVQYFLMRDLEKLTGALRIAIIYIGSGVGGNLASAIFVPYRADVGPAGAQFGLLACLIVEVLNSWPMLRSPEQALMKLLAITLILFIFGLLPWVDNFAHLFGFAFGFLLSYALLPFLSFGPYDRHKKIFLIWVCLLSCLSLFILLVLLFYFIPVYDCELCSYLNCLPLTRDFCASQNINLKQEDHLV